jgi:transposase
MGRLTRISSGLVWRVWAGPCRPTWTTGRWSACCYGIAILPARPYKPRDKAKVGQSVLIAERWILARLRNRRFLSLADLNVAIGELVCDVNARIMEGHDASRTELFAAIDRPTLKPLPDEPDAFAVWKRCRVAPDYHVEVNGHWYSAPFRLIKELVDVRVADKTVEIFLEGQRVASHARAPTGVRLFRGLGRCAAPARATAK